MLHAAEEVHAEHGVDEGHDEEQCAHVDERGEGVDQREREVAEAPEVLDEAEDAQHARHAQHAQQRGRHGEEEQEQLEEELVHQRDAHEEKVEAAPAVGKVVARAQPNQLENALAVVEVREEEHRVAKPPAVQWVVLDPLELARHREDVGHDDGHHNVVKGLRAHQSEAGAPQRVRGLARCARRA